MMWRLEVEVEVEVGAKRRDMRMGGLVMVLSFWDLHWKTLRTGRWRTGKRKC